MYCSVTVVDLDSLLILLKEELAPKWYDFGLIVGVPQDLMDSYSGYPPDQCLTEVLDYWLRHHTGKVKWTEVADALKALELNQLAEKAQKLHSLTAHAQKINGMLKLYYSTSFLSIVPAVTNDLINCMWL